MMGHGLPPGRKKMSTLFSQVQVVESHRGGQTPESGGMSVLVLEWESGSGGEAGVGGGEEFISAHESYSNILNTL